MNTTSQNAGMYAPPAADGPNRQHTCGTLPESRTWLAKIRPAPRRPGNSSTWSVMRAPAESTRYTTGQLVPQRVLGEPHDLLDRARAPRAGLHRRVVRHHAHRAAVDAADAGHDAVGRQVAGERVGEQAVLDERAVVEQQREPVAHEQLVLRARASRLPWRGCPAARARCAPRRDRSLGRSRRVPPRAAGPACEQRARQLAADDLLRELRARRAARRDRCRSRCPCRRSMCTRSSVTALPDAPGAYGQPPSPPIDASKRVTPRSSAATTFASAVPRVLWKCSPTRSRAMPGALERVEQIVDAPGRGHAGGVAEREPVGARVEQVARDLPRPAPARRRLRRGSRTRSTRSPRPAMPAPCASSTTSLRRRRATRRPSGARSSGCASRSRSRRARARRPRPRSRARRPSGSARAPSRRRPAPASIRAITSSAPAIGGIAVGDTNDAASMRRRPVRDSASISRTRSRDRRPAPRSAGRRAGRPRGSRPTRARPCRQVRQGCRSSMMRISIVIDCPLCVARVRRTCAGS